MNVKRTQHERKLHNAALSRARWRVAAWRPGPASATQLRAFGRRSAKRTREARPPPRPSRDPLDLGATWREPRREPRSEPRREPRSDPRSDPRATGATQRESRATLAPRCDPRARVAEGRLRPSARASARSSARSSARGLREARREARAPIPRELCALILPTRERSGTRAQLVSSGNHHPRCFRLNTSLMSRCVVCGSAAV